MSRKQTGLSSKEKLRAATGIRIGARSWVLLRTMKAACSPMFLVLKSRGSFRTMEALISTQRGCAARLMLAPPVIELFKKLVCAGPLPPR